MIALANGKDRLPDRIEPSIRLVIPNTNGQCRTIPGNHTNRFLAALSRTSSGMRYIDELHCSSNNTAISTTMPIQCARFHVNSRCIPRSAADCLAEFIFVAIVVWMLSRGGVAIPWPDGGSDTMSGSADGAASSSALDGSVADGGAADGGSSSSGSDITDADCPLETQTYPPAPASTVTNNY